MDSWRGTTDRRLDGVDHKLGGVDHKLDRVLEILGDGKNER